MRKIRKLKIKNFQSHKDRTFEFDDYTAIIGPSDKGKTAIVRALIWVLYNNPAGDSFITRGEDICSVTVIFDDDLEITRTKGSKTNSYDIKSGDEEIHLEAFGVGPVDEVVNAHGMRIIDIFGDKQSLNICTQLSEPFFLGKSPMNKAMIIGQLAKTEIIDLAIKNTSAEIRQKKVLTKEYKDKLKEVKSELSQLRGIGNLEKALDFSEKKLENLIYLNNKIESIKNILEKLNELDKNQKVLEEILESSKDSNELEELLNNAFEILNTVNKIKKVSNKLNDNISIYSKCSKLCVDSKCIDSVIEDIDLIIDSSKKIKKLKETHSRLKDENNKKEKIQKLLVDDEDLLNAISLVDKSLSRLEIISKLKNVNQKIKENEKRKIAGDVVINNIKRDYVGKLSEYKSNLSELKKCPICSSNIEMDDIERIVKDLNV